MLSSYRVKIILIFLPLILVSNQCQPSFLSPSPTASPTSSALLVVPPIQAGDGSDLIDRLLEKGVIRVGVRVWPEPDFAPPAFRGLTNAQTGGALNGFEIDIAHLIANGLGLELDLIEADPRVINGGDWGGKWDIALASLVPFDQPLKDSAASNMVYSIPYGYMPMGILIPNRNEEVNSNGEADNNVEVSNDEEVDNNTEGNSNEEADNIETLSQLSGRSVGVLEHSAYQRLLTPEELPLTIQGQPLMARPPEDLQLVILSNFSKGVRELGQNEGENAPLDAIFGPTPMLQAAVERDFSVKLAVGAKVIGRQPLVIASTPQDNLKVDRLMAEINKILEQLDQQGGLAEIYFRWYRQDFSKLP